MYRVVGYFFIASSSLLFLGLYKINCRSFLQIEMNYGKCGVEKKLIQKRVEEYFPKKDDTSKDETKND